LLCIGLAGERDRPAIYRLRHDVFARELRQHRENEAGQLSDHVDAHNLYIIIRRGEELIGCISITPPGQTYSIDRYLARDELPFPCDETLFEVRLLVVRRDYRQSDRGSEVAGLLVYAAVRQVEALGGRRVVAIGRREVMGFYRKIGLRPLGRHFQAGECTFELMTATLDELRRRVSHYVALLVHYAPEVDWCLDIPYLPAGWGAS
jgi:N-acyl-L-homoserine lactone synthetase